jgi:CBS domain-containing protein
MSDNTLVIKGEKMRSLGIGCSPVSNGGRLTGMVIDRDTVRRTRGHAKRAAQWYRR